jgi:hypothetical protein
MRRRKPTPQSIVLMALLKAEDTVHGAYENGHMDIRRCNRFLALFRDMDEILGSWNRSSKLAAQRDIESKSSFKSPAGSG